MTVFHSETWLVTFSYRIRMYMYQSNLHDIKLYFFFIRKESWPPKVKHLLVRRKEASPTQFAPMNIQTGESIRAECLFDPLFPLVPPKMTSECLGRCFVSVELQLSSRYFQRHMSRQRLAKGSPTTALRFLVFTISRQ